MPGTFLQNLHESVRFFSHVLYQRQKSLEVRLRDMIKWPQSYDRLSADEEEMPCVHEKKADPSAAEIMNICGPKERKVHVYV